VSEQIKGILGIRAQGTSETLDSPVSL